MTAILAIGFTVLIYVFFAYVEKKKIRLIGGGLMFIGLIISVLLMMASF